MNHCRTRLLLMSLCLFLLTSAVLGCASAAQPNAGADSPPLAQAEGTEDPTPTPEPTAEPVDPTKPPLPTEQPRPTREPRPPKTRPAPTPEPAHPDGLEGCKGVVLFDGDPTATKYMGWCMEQLVDHIAQQCSTQPADAQRQCGENIVQEYRSHLFRHGLPNAWAYPRTLRIASSGRRRTSTRPKGRCSRHGPRSASGATGTQRS